MTEITDVSTKFIDQAAVKTTTYDFAEAETGVYWDLEDYKIPDGLNPCKVSDNIKTALASLGYNGPVTIQAYCDETNQIKEEDGFLSAGIKLKHVPDGGKGKDYSRDYAMYRGMYSWTLKNCFDVKRPNLMVVADNIYTDMLNVLKESNFNVLWTSLSDGGMPIAQRGGRSSQRLDRTCPSCGNTIDHNSPCYFI